MTQRTAGEKVTAELESQGRSVRHLAEFAAVPEATLRLHIRNDDFGMKELGRIADALDVDIRDLISDELLKVATPGGRSAR
jgi:lambda repressor-like predicted transcriptional regulator